MTENEEDEAALDSYLLEVNKVGIKPLTDNPLDTTVTVTRRGCDTIRQYTSGVQRPKVVGDPYAAFAKGPDEIPL